MWRKSLRFSSKFLTSKNSLYLSSISSSAANDVVRHSLSQSHPYGIRALSAATAVGLASGATKASSHWAGRRHGRCYWELSEARLSSSAYAFATGHEHEEVEAQHEANNLTTGSNSTSEPSGTYSGHYGQNNVQLQQKLNGACADGSRDPQQSSNQYNPSYNGVFKRSTRNEFLTHSLQQDGNFCGHNGQENGGLLQTPELDWRHLENGSIQNPYESRKEGSIEVRQNPDGFGSQGNSGFQGNLNQNCMQNVAQYQQNVNGYDTRNDAMHQQNPSYGQYQQNPSCRQYQQNPSYGQNQQNPRDGKYQQGPGCGQYQQGPSCGQYQQGPSQYQHSPHVGQSQTNTDPFQNRIVDSQVASESKSQGKLIEASESSPYSGTLQKLDNFCKEGKVKEAVEILVVLEKQHVHVELHLYLQLMQACGKLKL